MNLTFWHLQHKHSIHQSRDFISNLDLQSLVLKLKHCSHKSNFSWSCNHSHPRTYSKFNTHSHTSNSKHYINTHALCLWNDNPTLHFTILLSHPHVIVISQFRLFSLSELYASVYRYIDLTVGVFTTTTITIEKGQEWSMICF